VSWFEIHRRLDRGEARGAERLLAGALYPVSLLYGLGIGIRNLTYDAHLLPQREAGCCVISVGGLSAGGSGKTPFAARLARAVGRMGYRPLLVARGYGAPQGAPESRLLSIGRPRSTLTESWETAGEEAVLLARLAPEVPVAIARRREDALGVVRGREFDPEVMILDGGFQYRRLKADLHVVMIDVSVSPGPARLLPWGGMREPWGSLKRADVLVLHRAELCADPEAWKDFLSRRAPGRPIVWCENRMGVPYPLSFPDLPEPGGWAVVAGKRWGVWTALGHPEAFLTGLGKHGVRPAWTRCQPDHAPFTRRQADELTWAARSQHLDGFLITEKDAVKVEAFGKQIPPIHVVPATLSLREGGETFEVLLREAIVEKVGRIGPRIPAPSL